MASERDNGAKVEYRAYRRARLGQFRPDRPDTPETPSDTEGLAAHLRPIYSEGERSLERVRPLIPELRLPPPDRAEWYQAAYSADSCRMMAEMLRSEYGHMQAEQQAKLAKNQEYRGTYAPHFQGDLGEIAAYTQWSRLGEASLLNETGKHDNHRYTDMSFTSDTGVNFEGDMKVSLSERPQTYYMRKLEEFEFLVDSKLLLPEQAQLFVPHDHVPALREAVAARFGDTSPGTRGGAWLSRIHETGLSSGQYRAIRELCTSPTDKQRIDIDRVRSLVDDLEAAADYIDSQLGRMRQ